MESADEDVVGNCCLSLTYFAEGDHARSGEVLVKLSELVHSLRKRLLELLQEKASLEDSSDDNDDDDDEDDADEKSKNAVAISLYLKRLAIVGKRWSIAKLLETDGTENGFQVVEELSTTISAMIAKDLSVRATPKNNDDDMSVVPEIWRKRGTREQHSFLADTIGSALSFLLSTASWMLEEFEEDKNYIEGEEGENSLVSQLLHMRERIRKVLLLCFEQFLEEEDRHSCSEAHLAFSQAVQRHASRAASELRALFPKLWSVKCGPVLKKLALSDDNDLVGANVRFLDSEVRVVPCSVFALAQCSHMVFLFYLFVTTASKRSGCTIKPRVLSISSHSFFSRALVLLGIGKPTGRCRRFVEHYQQQSGNLADL
jgi:hypothetical protein